MAKRKFGLSKTLNRNKKEELSEELPPKRPLPTKPKDIDQVEQKVNTIHQTEKSTPSTIPAVAKKVPATTKTKAAPRKKNTTAKMTTKRKTVKEGDMRLTFDIPRSLHKKLKIQAINKELTIKDYLINMIEKELK